MGDGQPPTATGPDEAIAVELRDDADAWAPRLVSVLDTQLELYQALDTLGQRQSELIANGETDALLTVLGKRQTIVDQVTKLNGALEPFTNAWPRLLKTLPGQHREAISGRLGRLDELVTRINERDEADREALAGRRAEVAKELGDTGRQRSAASAYARQSQQPHTPRYQDREG
jgi:hypothetical protein